MYRVSYFSAWQKPEHFENLSEEERDEFVHDGEQQQFKVIVTDMNEDRPDSWERR